MQTHRGHGRCRWNHASHAGSVQAVPLGLQCGFCTPGMVMSAVDLCRQSLQATDAEIRELLEAGNICRCAGTSSPPVRSGSRDGMSAAEPRITIQKRRHTTVHLTFPSCRVSGETVLRRARMIAF